ncbi:signal transduction histidine kinase/ligand-binding sensor domain-containing protein/DNA-binding response OmpR family regulator [Dysgonomonas hofstadii]|uniref:histidine kinase n=1 Tax=Dysgonomonas hofstadii TaxID=637886 RepID=A0A840CUB5_9BACT|nr:hybrid sensor histidine kinase/response regulator transcription factor [Dysgonomonas hofstadii]MBB4037284.1 signal transduction histidine kinase/ligand-binding sensor domain-containing protein/DNA-binding response OmpR family regulator [Dysgonomonas hofstadii]
MIKRNLSVLLLLLIVLTGNAYTNKRTPPIKFSSLSVENGLSQSTVFDIIQDKKGFLWIATADGLNRYDGYTFTVYRHENNNPNSIQSDFIRSLFINEKGELWIGTNAGIASYDSKKDIFSTYPYKAQINSIIQSSTSDLYLATSEGLLSYNIDHKTYRILSPKGILCENFHILAKYNDLILIGTDKGLYMMNPKDENIVLYRKELASKNIMDICIGRKGIWIATEGNGLYYIADDGNLKNYRNDKNDPNSISSDFVRSLCFDNQQRLWVGTFIGLNIYDEIEDTFSRYYSNEIEKRSINQNSVRTLYLDNQGAMWLGTFYGGLNYHHLLQNQFERIYHIPHMNSLSDNVVSCIVEDSPSELWIGTNDNGLNLYNLATKKFTYYTKNPNSNNAILSNNIKAVLVDGDFVYIGSHGGGMGKLDKRTNRIKNYTNQNSAVGSDNVYSLSKDIRGNIWIGTLEGLTIYNPQNDTFSSFDSFLQESKSNKELLKKLNKSHIYVLYLDTKQQMWFGTENGVYTYSFLTKDIKEYNIGIKNQPSTKNRIYCIAEDSQNRIWIGTNLGLNRLNDNPQSFKTITTADGLPNNNIYGILQDSFGRLWLSTNRGLACYNPNSEEIRTYTMLDGLQGEQFNNYAYCKTSSGEIFFGGINGITAFSPEHLTDNPFTPSVIITQLLLFNKPVIPGDNTDILSEDISETKKIILKPNQTSFGLLFTVPNYLSAQHNTFAYKLDGFDNDWTYTDDRRMISYSNLKHGKYTFYVKAANNAGKWNDEPTILEIEILPYWWETVWAKTLFILIGLITLFLLFKFFYNRQLLKNQLALERLEKEKIEEVNQMKLRFFINISHEFRTPLTLIVSPLQEIQSMTNDKRILNQVKTIQRNSNKLLYLVNQLMDYRRAELGVFELKVVEQNLLPQVENSMNLFERLSKQKNIDFILEDELRNKPALYDPHYLDLILSNLLSNAFKFTPDNGSIIINLKFADNNFILSVKDTGIGISPEYQARIFERFYQVNSDNIGTGIGLSLVKRLVDLHHGHITVESVPGKSSEFTVFFPQDKELYSQNELSDIHKDDVLKNTFRDDVDIVRLLKENDREVDLQEEISENKPSLLIIEDDLDVRNYLVDNFRPSANVLAVADGEEGLKLIKENKIDLVITDLMLPGIDGLKVCKSIKQNIRTSHIPVIMLTAKTNQQDQIEGLSVGADDYVYKPFNISILKMKVHNMIKSRARTLEHYSNSLDVDPQMITFNEMDKEFLEKAKSIVEQNLDNIDFSVDDFCAQMAMSRSNLHLKMKAITGESTIEFIKKIRFSHACNLLKEGRYSIAEISVMVGFNTPSYFTSSFKKYFGILPTEYVKDIKKTDK